MAILISPEKRVIVQGITGREGIARTRLMKNYHTQVVGGMTPGNECHFLGNKGGRIELPIAGPGEMRD